MERRENRLLQRLPAVYREALIASMEEVMLPVSSVLYEAGKAPKHAHFLLSGAVSVVVTFENGDSVEVMTVGKEGLVEVAHLLAPNKSPTRAVVQTECVALRMPLKELRRHFSEYPPLRAVLLSYVQSRMLILEQLSACNRYHEVGPRMARWLLMMQDCLGSDVVSITQEDLAELLGTRRTTVTWAARRLQSDKIIRYSRGVLRIVNRKALEREACECYEIMRRFATVAEAAAVTVDARDTAIPHAF